jgi:hypothetical protein
MTRTLLALMTLAAGTGALAAPPEGSWKMRMAATDRSMTLLFAFSRADGKWACDFIDSRPAFQREPKVTAVTVNGDAVRFTLSIAGRDFFTFDGTVAKDGKKMTGSFAQPGGPLQVTELTPSQLKKLDDPFAINRELLEQAEATSPDLFDYGFEILPLAAAKKLTAEEVRGMADKLTKAAPAYGPRWDRSVALKIANALVDQPGLADVALAQARRAERLLAEDDPVTDRLDVLDVLNRSLTKANKPDEAKPVATQVARLEARDFADYLKASPLGEVADYKGRKAKSDRVVVVEAFVGSEFTLSAPVEQGLDGLIKAYKPTDVLALNYHYHLPEPSQGDPLTVPETGERLQPLIPEIQKGTFTYVAGKAGPKSTDPRGGKDYFDALRAAVDEQLEKPAGCKIALTVAKGAKGSDVKAAVSDLVVGPNKFALKFVVVEPRVRYAGGNGCRYHQNVVRALPGGAKGFPLTKPATEQAIVVDVNDIRASLTKSLNDFAKAEGEFPRSARPMELKNLKVIAFVQNDGTGEILTAAAVDLP